MRYCQFCGAKVADGQQCTCKRAREIAARSPGGAGRQMAGTMNRPASASGSLYQKIMMAFGAVQVLIFFFLSYAKLNGSGSMVKSIASLVGIDIPRRLTGLTAIRLMQGCAEYGVENAELAMIELAVLLGAPVLCGILIVVLNLKGKPGGMLSSVSLSVVTLLCYLVAQISISGSFETLGYEMGLGFGIVFLVTAAQIVAAFLGHIAGKKAKAAV